MLGYLTGRLSDSAESPGLWPIRAVERDENEN